MWTGTQIRYPEGEDPTPYTCRGKSGRAEARCHNWDGPRPVPIGNGVSVGSCSRCGGKVTLKRAPRGYIGWSARLVTDPAEIARIKEILFAAL